MTQSQYDSAAFKVQQREQWSNAAQGWRKWWPILERGAQPVSDRLVQLAAVEPGMRVLDVATGIGEPAVTAARRVGPTGSVIAVDQAPQMLAMARERASEAGLTNVEFVESDAEQLNVPSGSFDAVLCRWGLMFFPDIVGTLSRFHTVLKPGGRLAAAVWGPPERVPMISFPFAVFAREFGGPPPGQPSGPNPFALSEPAALEKAVRDAGFVDVASEPFPVTYEFSSVDELLQYTFDVSPLVPTVLTSQSPERQAELRGKLAEAAQRFKQPDGAVRSPNEALIVTARA